MKFHKFKADVEKNPWLVDLIDPLGHMRHDPKTYSVKNSITPELRDFVRQRLEYIAPRPICGQRHLEEILYAEHGYYQVMTSSENALSTDPYYGGDPETSYDESWHLIWNVDSTSKGPWAVGEEMSAYDEILRILDRHEKGHYGKGELDFSHIVKVTETKSSRIAPVKMAIEIFTLPQLWFQNVRSKQVVSSERLRIRDPWEPEAARAYANGGEMPPIIPGALLVH